MAAKRTTPFGSVEEELKWHEENGTLERENVFEYAKSHKGISAILETFPSKEAGWREACLQVCDKHIRHFRVTVYHEDGEPKKLKIRHFLWEKEAGAYSSRAEVLADPDRALNQAIYVIERALGVLHQTPLKETKKWTKDGERLLAQLKARKDRGAEATVSRRPRARPSANGARASV